MKKIPALFPAAARILTAVLMAAVVLACGNPAMKEILRPLYEDEEKEEGNGSFGPVLTAISVTGPSETNYVQGAAFSGAGLAVVFPASMWAMMPIFRIVESMVHLSRKGPF
jgi:hypothetical protein